MDKYGKLILIRERRALTILDSAGDAPDPALWSEVMEAAGLDIGVDIKQEMQAGRIPTPGTADWSKWYRKRMKRIAVVVRKPD